MKIPLLQLEKIVLCSVQVDLSDADAMQFQTDVVRRIADTESMGIIIDITALDVVDSFMARVINDTAGMAKLLGAEVVVCGIQPFVALTLIEMGRDLIGADCTFNLSQGLELLKSKIASRGDAGIGGDDSDAWPIL